MNMILKVLLGINALLFIVIGAQMMFTPVEGAGALGLTGDFSVMAKNTIRGDLSGLFMGSALLVIIGLRTQKAAWFQAVAVLMIVVMVGRVVGLVVDGYAVTSVASLGLEAAIVVLMHFAANQSDA